jgi:hypothetical protein
VFHNRGNAWRGKGEYAKAIADYDAAIKRDINAGATASGSSAGDEH